MKKAIYWLCVLLCFGLVPAAGQTGEWQVLFNGRDLTGWRANLDPAAFTVKDGVLRIQSSSETRAHLFIEFAPPRQLNRCAASLGCKILAYPREIFERVVTMTAGHPAAVFKNTMGSPAQMWRSRYAFFFQVPGISDWYVKRNNFAYIETLWRDWAAPGWTLPREHLDGVKRTLEASMPSPILHYRSGGINAGKDWKKIPTPTLYLIGAEDGCVLPQMSAGQEDYFAGEFKAETIPKAGHFLHLEQPEVVGEKVTQWLKQA